MNTTVNLPNGVVLDVSASDLGAVTLGFSGAKFADIESYERDPQGSVPPQIVLSVPAVA